MLCKDSHNENGRFEYYTFAARRLSLTDRCARHVNRRRWRTSQIIVPTKHTTWILRSAAGSWMWFYFQWRANRLMMTENSSRDAWMISTSLTLQAEDWRTLPINLCVARSKTLTDLLYVIMTRQTWGMITPTHSILSTIIGACISTKSVDFLPSSKVRLSSISFS